MGKVYVRVAVENTEKMARFMSKADLGEGPGNGGDDFCLLKICKTKWGGCSVVMALWSDPFLPLAIREAIPHQVL